MKRTVMLLGLMAALGARAEILYQETFSEATPELGWLSTWGESSDQVEVTWMNGNPAGDGFVGTLGNGLSGGGVGTAVVAAPELTDYALSAQVYLVPGTTHYRGIVGRVSEFATDSTSNWGFYAFVADLSTGATPSDERLMLRKWLPGSSMMTTIKVWSHSELGDLYPSTEGWHEMGMSFQGDQITCFIDGQELPSGTWTDDSFSGGGFGVYYFDMMDTAGHLSFDDVLVESGTTGVAPAERPSGLALGRPWPNPFNPTVRVPLQLARAGHASARVHDLKGRLVATLVEGELAAGSHQLVWNGLDLAGRPAASGLYLLDVRADGRSAATRLLLTR